MTDLLVIGGGVAGLTAALRAVEADPALRVTVLERAARPGGKIRTLREEGFWIDLGPDVFVARRPEVAALCRDAGLESALRSVGGRTRILRDGALHPLPDGWSGLAPGRLGPLLRSPLLPLRGRVRAALEPFVAPRKTDEDESLAAFFTRRFGRSAYDHLIEPLVGGLFGADLPVSLRATLPHLHEMEGRGGLVRAWKRQRGAGGAPFRGLEGGLARLTKALAARLAATGRVTLHTGVPVTALTPMADGFRAEAGEASCEARAAVVALPAPAAARVLEPLGGAVTAPLMSIPHGSVGAVALAYETAQITRPLHEATGFLVPQREGGPVQAVTLFSAKHPGSAPEDHSLFRVFVRPEKDGSLAPLPDLIDRAESVLQQMLGVRGAPVWTAVHAWENAMPRFTLGHLDRMQALRSALARHPGLFLAGAPYRGAGLPDAIASAEAAARDVFQFLTAPAHVH